MKVWTKDEIKGLIESRDDAVVRGMLRIYGLQTESEQVFGDTHEHNGVGFSGVDGGIMSSFTEFYNKAGFLSSKQMKIAKKASPRNRITGADFLTMKGKKTKVRKKA